MLELSFSPAATCDAYIVKITRSAKGVQDTRSVLSACRKRFLDLQQQGCCSLEPVSPSHHLPGFLVAVAEAIAKGMTLPIVYNTNGYESPETLELLDGIVDVYLPDLKYASEAQAARYSATPDYVEIARAAILNDAFPSGKSCGRRGR